MKVIILLFLMLLANSCTIRNNTSNQANDTREKKIEKIELREQTRGTNRSFVLNSENLIITLNEKVNDSKISLLEWENIEKQINYIDLSKISSFEAPTTDHYSDQSLASTIIITSSGKTHQSSSFDAGNPPKELAPLYKAIQQVIQSKKTTQ